MSTKAIRMTLEWVKEQLEDSLDRPFSRDQTKLDEMRLAGLKKALAEVEAIEKAEREAFIRGMRAAADVVAEYGNDVIPAVDIHDRITSRIALEEDAP